LRDAAAGSRAKTFVMSGYLFHMPAETLKRRSGTRSMKPIRPIELLDTSEREHRQARQLVGIITAIQPAKPSGVIVGQYRHTTAVAWRTA
jgi:hypothetical protein